MTTWRDSSASLIVPNASNDAQPFADDAKDAVLHLSISGEDTVLIQRKNNSDAWETFKTFVAADDKEQVAQVANQPAWRIVATGSALFKWIWRPTNYGAPQ